jgi:hypothetical protein
LNFTSQKGFVGRHVVEMREFLKPDKYWIQVKTFNEGDETNV